MTDAYDDGYEEALDHGQDFEDQFLAPKSGPFEMDPEEGGRGFTVEGEGLLKPGTVLRPGVMIAEDFGQDCCVCGMPISSGQVIHKVKGSSWKHEGCLGEALWERNSETNPTAAEWLYQQGRQS